MNPNKDRLASRLAALIFDEMRDFQAESRRWEQKYHSAMAANKRLDEQNEELGVEKQALLDVVSGWKSENHSLTALNETLSKELGVLKKEDQLLTKTVQNWQRNYTSIKHELDLAQQELANKNAENLNLNCMLQKLTENYDRIAAELAEEKERCASQYQDFLKQEQSSQNWQANYYAMQKLKNSLAKELDVVTVRYEEADKVGNQWFEDFKNLTVHCGKLKTELEASKEQHEDLKKKSHGILATLEENLQKKQETIEALEIWKKGTESVLDTLDARLKDAIAAGKVQEGTIELLVTQKQELSENLHALKQINSFQEHRIEVLARKVNKMRKKEQND